MDLLDLFLKEVRIVDFIQFFLCFISILTSLFFLFIIKYSFFKGMAISFICISLFQLTLEIHQLTNYRVTLSSPIVQAPENNLSEKLQQVEDRQLYIRYVCLTEILFAGTGILLFFFFKPVPFWRGLGLGLVIINTVFVILNQIEGNKLNAYLHYLSKQVFI